MVKPEKPETRKSRNWKNRKLEKPETAKPETGITGNWKNLKKRKPKNRKTEKINWHNPKKPETGIKWKPDKSGNFKKPVEPHICSANHRV